MIVIWFTVALAVVLSPAPRMWGHSTLQNFYEDHRGLIQIIAHFIVMGGFAMIVSPMFDEKPLIYAALLTIGAAILVATLLELLQLFLPVPLCQNLRLFRSAALICRSDNRFFDLVFIAFTAGVIAPGRYFGRRISRAISYKDQMRWCEYVTKSSS